MHGRYQPQTPSYRRTGRDRRCAHQRPTPINPHPSPISAWPAHAPCHHNLDAVPGNLGVGKGTIPASHAQPNSATDCADSASAPRRDRQCRSTRITIAELNAEIAARRRQSPKCWSRSGNFLRHDYLRLLSTSSGSDRPAAPPRASITLPHHVICGDGGICPGVICPGFPRRRRAALDGLGDQRLLLDHTSRRRFLGCRRHLLPPHEDTATPKKSVHTRLIAGRLSDNSSLQTDSTQLLDDADLWLSLFIAFNGGLQIGVTLPPYHAAAQLLLPEVFDGRRDVAAHPRAPAAWLISRVSRMHQARKR